MLSLREERTLSVPLLVVADCISAAEEERVLDFLSADLSGAAGADRGDDDDVDGLLLPLHPKHEHPTSTCSSSCLAVPFLDGAMVVVLRGVWYSTGLQKAMVNSRQYTLVPHTVLEDDELFLWLCVSGSSSECKCRDERIGPIWTFGSQRDMTCSSFLLLTIYGVNDPNDWIICECQLYKCKLCS